MLERFKQTAGHQGLKSPQLSHIPQHQGSNKTAITTAI